MTTKTKRKLGVAMLAAIWLTSFAVAAARAAVFDSEGPELPAACSELQVDAGNKLAFHVYATGSQIYRWTGTAWVLFAPDAKLYVNENYQGLVGTHFGGPTWKSNSGSSVVAARVKDCLPDTNAIAWLKLQTVVAEGPGIFSRVTFIQRVNTVGGLKPTSPGSFVGDEVKVPYTAEYYFYRATDNPTDESN
ncbi:MAG: DUF3455 domain-containing protein [Pyrinomonadaceae bacterium]